VRRHQCGDGLDTAALPFHVTAIRPIDLGYRLRSVVGASGATWVGRSRTVEAAGTGSQVSNYAIGDRLGCREDVSAHERAGRHHLYRV
jgi:hypothetical protein